MIQTVLTPSRFLTAIATLFVAVLHSSAQTPQNISIFGPTELNENSSAVYRAVVTYTDLSVKVVTPIWSNQTAGTVDVTKTLKLVAPPYSQSTSIDIAVSYTESGTTVEDSLEIDVSQLQISGEPSLENSQYATSGRPESIAGHQVDTATGAQILKYQFLRFEGGIPFELGLGYNSLFPDNPGIFGPGWEQDYEINITGVESDIMYVDWSSGLRNRFQFIDEIGEEKFYAPIDDSNRRDSLVRTSSTWELTLGDGTTYIANTSNGRVYRIFNKVGDQINVNSDNIRFSDTGDYIRFVFDEDGRVDYLYDETNDDSGEVSRYVYFEYNEDGRLHRVSQEFELDSDRFINNRSYDIPDNNLDGVTFTITVDREEPIGALRIINGEIGYQVHKDITLTLISPEGTELILFSDNDFNGIRDGNNLYLEEATGIFREFEGENPFGEWTVIAVDNAPSPEWPDGDISGVTLLFSDETHPTEFTYDSEGRIATVSDPIGQILANTYDDQGRVAQQDDGIDTNQFSTFAYEETGSGTLITTYKDREGAVSIFEHDGRYNLISWTDPIGGEIQFEYDTFGNRTSYTDQLGRVTTMQYDANNNLNSAVDPIGRSVVFDHDQYRNVTFVLDSRGNQSAFEYDDNLNLDAVTDAVGKTTRKEFTTNSDLETLILPDGGMVEFDMRAGRENWRSHASSSGRREFREYDRVGRVVEFKDKEGWDTYYRYSSTGKKLSETDAFIKTVRFEYDARDRLVKETDKNGNETLYEYDGNDNLVKLTNALGFSKLYEYDGEDRLDTVIDENGNASHFLFDDLGRTIAEIDALGNITQYEYDAVGNLIETYDALGNLVQSITYTELDQEQTITDARGNTVTQEYDENGNLIRIIDPLGRRTAIAYDSLDRTTSITDPLNRVVRKIYNDDNTVNRIDNPGGSESEYTYDDANRVTEVTYGERTLTYEYDWRNDITTAQDGPSVFEYEYDRVGRRVLATSDDNGTTGDITYEYDNQGNLTRTSNDGSNPTEILREYDALNRTTHYTDVFENEISYQYDPAGNLSSITYPDDKTVSYGFDALNRLTTVTDWDDRVTTYTYNENDLITRIEFPNGTFRVMAYNNASRLEARGDYTSDGTPIVAYQYSYDNLGEVVSVVRIDKPEEPYIPQLATFSYDINNVLTSYNGSAMTNDEKGNLETIPYDGGIMTAEYYGNNSLSWTSHNNGYSYSYDLEDRLVAISDQNSSSRFIVNPHAGLTQYLQKIDNSTDITSYVYGIGLIYEEDTSGDLIVYHYDDRGSTVAQTGPTGEVVKEYAYGPYGERIQAPEPGDSPFLYMGMFGVLTDDSGLCYMRFRHYSPTLRRFVGPDSFPGDEFNLDSLNKYAYALGNPIGFNDPEGEFINIVVGAVAGAVGGVVAQGVSDLITGDKPDWKNYVSAAAGGAVTGALIGSGAGVVFAGAAGGFTQEFLNQGLNGGFSDIEQFDVGQLALSTAIGGAAGAIGTKVKSATGIATKATFRKQVLYKGLLYGTKGAARKSAAREIVKQVAFYAAGSTVGKVVSLGASALAEQAMSALRDYFYVDVSRQSKSRFNQIRQYIDGYQSGRNGAFNHFELYQSYMGLAGIPMPNSPNSDVSGF
ncbi:DUF6531 domain-containing protein [Puniceicoccaceae bacterium K14]|nr:DUF6531 domain-containing protein [Puniceicoccaceae bacterium K14]